MGANTAYCLEGKGISHHSIYRSLDHYGASIISHIPLEEAEILAIEDLTLEILERTREQREVECLPVILGRNVFSPESIAEGAIERRLVRKTGYICELTLNRLQREGSAKNRSELLKVIDFIYPHIEEGYVPLISGLTEDLIKYFASNDDPFGKKWKVISCLDNLVLQ